jgi:hypothetical protein
MRRRRSVRRAPSLRCQQVLANPTLRQEIPLPDDDRDG